MRIIFVCTGNTCRSPMAKFILEDLLAQHNRLDIEVSSAGLMAHVGDPISGHAYGLLLENNIDARLHQATLFSSWDIATDTLILTMGLSHKMSIITAYPHLAKQTFTLSEYVGEKGSIADPFGGSLDHYRVCMTQITYLIEKLYLTLE